MEALAGEGYRVLAVAAGPEGGLRLAGLIALQDPPREDSQAVVRSLSDLGVRVVMVTGDGPATAQAVAAQVGIQGGTCLADASVTITMPGTWIVPCLRASSPKTSFTLSKPSSTRGMSWA